MAIFYFRCILWKFVTVNFPHLGLLEQRINSLKQGQITNVDNNFKNINEKLEQKKNGIIKQLVSWYDQENKLMQKLVFIDFLDELKTSNWVYQIYLKSDV